MDIEMAIVQEKENRTRLSVVHMNVQKEICEKTNAQRRGKAGTWKMKIRRGQEEIDNNSEELKENVAMVGSKRELQKVLKDVEVKYELIQGKRLKQQYNSVGKIL